MLPAGPASNDKTAPEVGEDASGYLHLSVVQDSIQRWNVLSSLLEPLPKPSPRVLSFASQSKGLSGSDTQLSSISAGPMSTIGVRLQGTVIDEILPWGSSARMHRTRHVAVVANRYALPHHLHLLCLAR